MCRGGERVWLWSGFSLLYYHSSGDTRGEINASQDESVQYTHTFLFIFPALCSTAQFNFLYPIPSHLSGATSLSAEGTLAQPSPPSPSLSRHCCCEDEMSVLLKVPLKHNSDLWCLIVSFQSCERRWEHILIARGYFRAPTTDGLHREVLLTTSVLFIRIQIS